MNYKFIQPVAMRATEEQYQRDLREPLLKMGYKESTLQRELGTIVATSYSGINDVISNYYDICIYNYNRYFIPDYNPELFLAIAAMTDKETAIVGEWIVYTNNMAEICGLTAGELYRTGELNTNTRYMRKATLQELIEKFTTKGTIKESIMKIEVIKPKEKVKWNFPCKGISKTNKLIVGFSEYGTGAVLDVGDSKTSNLYEWDRDWIMEMFTPIKEQENGNNYDWSNPTFPILVKGSGDDVFTINGFDEVDNSVSITTFSFNKKVHYWCEEIARFPSEEDRNKWLKSLEIYPKGTEIKITF